MVQINGEGVMLQRSYVGRRHSYPSCGRDVRVHRLSRTRAERLVLPAVLRNLSLLRLLSPVFNLQVAATHFLNDYSRFEWAFLSVLAIPRSDEINVGESGNAESSSHSSDVRPIRNSVNCSRNVIEIPQILVGVAKSNSMKPPARMA